MRLAEDELAELHRRTEGWAAGLYLAALYLRESGSLPGMAASFGGDDRLVSESGRPAEAEQWADAADRWLYQDTSRAANPFAEALVTMLRYTLCRDGVEQMRADADEAVRRYAAAGRMPPTVPTAQGIARILCGDLDGGDAYLEDAVRIGDRGAPDVVVRALSQRALVAIERLGRSLLPGGSSG